MSRRLELLFNEPNLKIDDVILSEGDDEEMMELVRRFSHHNINTADDYQEMSEEDLRNEIQKHEEEFADILSDLRRMGQEQAAGHPENRCEILLKMIEELQETVKENDNKLQDIEKKIADAQEVENSLKEQISELKADRAKFRFCR